MNSGMLLEKLYKNQGKFQKTMTLEKLLKKLFGDYENSYGRLYVHDITSLFSDMFYEERYCKDLKDTKKVKVEVLCRSYHWRSRSLSKQS